MNGNIVGSKRDILIPISFIFWTLNAFLTTKHASKITVLLNNGCILKFDICSIDAWIVDELETLISSKST